MTQSSDTAATNTDSSGVGYGVNVSAGGVSLTASGFTSEGVGNIAGLDTTIADESNEAEGYLVQA